MLVLGQVHQLQLLHVGQLGIGVDQLVGTDGLQDLRQVLQLAERVLLRLAARRRVDESEHDVAAVGPGQLPGQRLGGPAGPDDDRPAHADAIAEQRLLRDPDDRPLERHQHQAGDEPEQDHEPREVVDVEEEDQRDHDQRPDRDGAEDPGELVQAAAGALQAVQSQQREHDQPDQRDRRGQLRVAVERDHVRHRQYVGLDPDVVRQQERAEDRQGVERDRQDRDGQFGTFHGT